MAYTKLTETWDRKRRELGLTQADLAQSLGMSQSSVSDYLNGKLLGTHENGYTSAIWRLDSVPGAALRFGDGGDNVLAVFVDARMAHCTGWCEGPILIVAV